MTMCSWSAWAPSPTQPSPSRVAVWRLVVFPSEPPPAMVSSSSKPSSSPTRRAVRQSWRFRGVRSRGATRIPPLTSTMTPGVEGSMARTFRSSSSPSSTVTTRTSTLARASAAMTLGRVPPSMRPTLTVTPREGSLSRLRIWITWESSTMALAPASGSSPACAARPRTVISKRPTPFRAVLISPEGPRISARSTRFASRRTWRTESGLPTSSSAFTKTTGVTSGSSPSARKVRRAKTICVRPPFMSSVPGPCRRSLSTRTGIRSSVPRGQTVSLWPTRSWAGAPRRRFRGMARKWSPLTRPGTMRTS